MTYLVKLKAALKKESVDAFKVMVGENVKQKRDSAQAEALRRAMAEAKAAVAPTPPASTPSFIARMLG